MPQFLEYFDNPSNFLQGAITASLLAGSFAGSLLTGAYLTDGIGRKKTLLLGSAVFTLGCILAAASVNMPMLIAGRVVNGLGNGCLTMTVSWVRIQLHQRERLTIFHQVSMYQGEISPVKYVTDFAMMVQLLMFW